MRLHCGRSAGLCALRYLSQCREGRTDKLGPNLWGVYGGKMGQGSFNFSDVLRTSNLKLDYKPFHVKALDKRLENPRALVPGQPHGLCRHKRCGPAKGHHRPPQDAAFNPEGHRGRS